MVYTICVPLARELMCLGTVTKHCWTETGFIWALAESETPTAKAMARNGRIRETGCMRVPLSSVRNRALSLLRAMRAIFAFCAYWIGRRPGLDYIYSPNIIGAGGSACSL